MKALGKYLLLWYGLVAVVLRLPVFFPLVIDHDESTYILIADQLLSGRIPYIDNLDIKPVGIYLVFALILKVFQSVFAIRMFTALVIALSGYLLYRIHFVLFSHRRTAMLTGLLYIICASAHKWSWPSNTEIFFQCLTIAGLYLLLISRNIKHFAGFGLITGLGFLIKFHIAFDILALVIFYFFWSGKKAGKWLQEMFTAFIFFLIPLVSVVFYYWSIGHLNELKFALLEIPGQYSNVLNPGRLMRFVAEFYLSFLPVIVMLLYGLWIALERRWMLTSHWVLLISWTVLAWLGITMTGKFFFHYYFQALPPLCLFALTFFMIKPQDQLRRFFLYKWWYPAAIFSGLLTVSWTNQYIQILSKPDYTGMIYDELKKHWRSGDQIYTTDQSILYYLLDCQPPTRYVHTSILFNRDLIRAYEVNTGHEFANIVSQKMNYYVISRNVPALIKEDIRKHFELIKIFPDNIRLFRRRKSG